MTDRVPLENDDLATGPRAPIIVTNGQFPRALQVLSAFSRITLPLAKRAGEPSLPHGAAVPPPRLDRQICLLKRTEQRDAAGNAYETWEESGAPLWAGLDRLTASDTTLALQTRSTRVERFITRFLACLEEPSAPTDYRIRYNERDYELIAAYEDTRRPRLAWMYIVAGFVEGQQSLTVADVPAAV